MRHRKFLPKLNRRLSKEDHEVVDLCVTEYANQRQKLFVSGLVFNLGDAFSAVRFTMRDTYAAAGTVEQAAVGHRPRRIGLSIDRSN